MFKIDGDIMGISKQFGAEARPRLKVRYLLVWRSEESGYLCMNESSRNAWMRNCATSEVFSGDEVEYRTHSMYPPETELVCTRDEAAYLSIMHYEGKFRKLKCDLRR